MLLAQSVPFPPTPLSMRRFALGLAVVFSAATSASAQITTLFNTGVQANNSVLANGSVDTHYMAFSFSTLGTPGALIGQAETLNNGYQTYGGYAQNASSRWIWANQSGNLDGQNYNTLFRTTFDLTGYDLSTVSISAFMAADNNIAGVFLNGSTLGQSYGSFGSFDNFAILSGFGSGVNTLDFYAQDFGPPAGFNAYYTSTGSLADVTTTPEPASMALLATGLAGLFGVTRRRRNKISA